MATLSHEQLDRIKVVQDQNELLEAARNAGSFYVWHCAADMRYDMASITESLEINVGLSSSLFENLSSLAQCRRFYHVSTAYTAGFNNLEAKEKLHHRPQLINAYQISKWTAELSLAAMAQEFRRPLTIIRPSIVIGHEQTGWFGKNRFGLHGALSSFRNVAKLIKDKLMVDLKPDTQPNYIPINRVIDTCMAIMAQDDTEHTNRSVEIYHLAAEQCFNNAKMAEILGRLCNVEIRFGPSESRFDERFNEMIAANQAFASHTWAFCKDALKRKIAGRYKPFNMDEKVLLTVFNS
jgi:nucleoside-diphosphate-sugar epimerase